jgi:L-serine dehydratase
MATTVADVFRIGLGPSSSHTVGPMRAAATFAQRVGEAGALDRTSRVLVELFGSLALTGKGHGTDRAVLLGLEGYWPDRTDPADADRRPLEIRAAGALRLNGKQPIRFDADTDLLFLYKSTLPRHSNAMRMTAFDAAGAELLSETYYSVGGGAVEREGDDPAAHPVVTPQRYPFTSAAELLAICEREGLDIWQIVLANEAPVRDETATRAYISSIWEIMESCAARGLVTEGILPGGLNVRRRAPRLHARLRSGHASGSGFDAMEYVNIIAMAVNEENAAGGRVVTAPTNGAAGVVPAVGHYYRTYVDGANEEGLFRFFLTATAIGKLYKENASISGAEVGCQGEVGVACSMAAAGLVAALNGTNGQAEYAAEIGMEHSLGMTCDPIGGLVQIPCIERNAVGAVRAIHAARMALQEEDEHTVSLDNVIEVMYRTGMDMQTKYKETSLGGLAVGVVEC